MKYVVVVFRSWNNFKDQIFNPCKVLPNTHVAIGHDVEGSLDLETENTMLRPKIENGNKNTNSKNM